MSSLLQDQKTERAARAFALRYLAATPVTGLAYQDPRHAEVDVMEPDATDTLVRAARELLRWDQKRLAERAKVGVATVRRFETGMAVSSETVEAIARALRQAGVAFLGPGNPGVGIKEGVALTSKGSPLDRPGRRVYKKRAKTLTLPDDGPS